MRKLTLKKETLAELSAADLAEVVGAMNKITQVCGSDLVACVPTYRCPTGDCVASLQAC